MKISEFVNNFNLHDSYIESVEYNKEKREVQLIVHFAFWMQKDYIEGTPETGLIKVLFQNVNKYSCDNGDPTGSFVGILRSEIRDDNFVLKLLDDETVECFEMVIISDEVIVNTINE